MSDIAPGTFEIGLIMAGAISAGAYTAGVMDFLVEAMDAWEAAKAAAEDVPRHDVSLKVMTGASAGAITTAIAAVSLFADDAPVHDVDAPPAAQRNRYYDAWVRQIDISRLLTDHDLGPSQPLRSLLDSTALDQIATAALNMPARAAPRRWVADPLAMYLTVTNLRGVPYAFAMMGSSGSSDFGMTAHRDYMAFALGHSGGRIPGARSLNPADLDPAAAPPAEWAAMAKAALASSAFPLGLQSRALTRPFSDYSHRDIGLPNVPDPPSDYVFGNVDGGAIDNEPLELARRHLAGRAGARNPRGGLQAHRAVIMIDPFPNRATLAPDGRDRSNLFTDAGALFAALMNQARFKPEELRLATRGDVYSRFVIHPSRRDPDGQPVDPAIASGILGGFGGFLSEQFRRHDFQLGRRNCQRFLHKYFVLPEGNTRVFGTLDPATVQAWCVRDDDGARQPWTFADDRSQRLMPIIPLVRGLETEEQLHATPDRHTVDLLALDNMIRRRIRPVANRVFDRHLGNLLPRGIARSLARLFVDMRLRPRLAKMAVERISAELDRLR